MSSETAREKVLRLMKGVVTEHIDDVMYIQWLSQDMPSVIYEKLKTMNIRTEDVLQVGWPRSGNHWTYYVLDMILKQKATPTTKSFGDAFADYHSPEARAEWLTQPSPRMFCTHVRMRRLPQVVDVKPKIIFIMRNPKDAMISFYKVMSSLSSEFGFRGTWGEFFDAVVAGEMAFGSWVDHVLAMESFIEEHPDVPVYIHQFEEMREKPVECIRKLSAFLGVSDVLAEEIADATGLEGVRSAVEQHKDLNNKVFEQGREGSFIQKGTVGSWKKVFTVEQNERFNTDFDQKMSGSKLGERVRRYI